MSESFPAIYTHPKVPDSQWEILNPDQAEAAEGLGWRRLPKTKQPETGV